MGVKKVTFVTKESLQNRYTQYSDQNEKEWLFDDALELIGFGKVQYYMIGLGALMLIGILNESMGPMLLQTTAQCDLQLDSKEKGLLTSAAFMGLMIPSYMWGYISDQYGRRNSMIYTLFATNFFAVCSTFAPNFLWLCIMRFCVGFFVSACNSSVYPYVGEFMSTKHRATALACCSIGSGLSLALSPVIAWIALQFDFKFMIFNAFVFRPWRLITIGLTLPGFIAAIILLYFPESPRFYMAQGNEEKALEVLKWIYRINTDAYDQYYPVKKLIKEREITSTNMVGGKTGVLKLMWYQTVTLFKPPLIIPLLLCCYLFIVAMIVSGGFGLWAAEVLSRLSKSTGNQTMCQAMTIVEQFEKQEACDDSISTEAFLNMLLLGIFYLCGYIAVSILMKPLGRKTILGICFSGSALSGLTSIWIVNSTFQVMSLSLFLVLTGITISLISGAAVMIFPTHIRATAICIIMMIGRISTAISSTVIGLTIDTYCVQMISFMVSIVFVAAILNFFLK